MFTPLARAGAGCHGDRVQVSSYHLYPALGPAAKAASEEPSQECRCYVTASVLGSAATALDSFFAEETMC